MQAPRLEKIVVNIGIGEAIQNAKALDAAMGDLQAITGQKPITKKAKKSIAQFRLREGMTVGLMVTLRGDRMYEFLDRLCQRGPAAPAGLPGRADPLVRRARQLLAGPARSSWCSRDRLRQDRQAARLEITMVTSARTDQEGAPAGAARRAVRAGVTPVRPRTIVQNHPTPAPGEGERAPLSSERGVGRGPWTNQPPDEIG